MEDTVKKNPVKAFLCGPVRASVWSDSRVMDNSLVELHSVRITRSYRDKDNGEWKYTTTFNAEDLPKVAVVAMACYKHLRLRSFETNNSNMSTAEEAGHMGQGEVTQ